MTDTGWANAEFSSRLPELRAKGESSTLEYMAVFPTNVRELAKEIAAFATSGGGLILLGVTDEGDLIGIDSIASAEDRDGILRRLEGICHGPVKPSVTPHVMFGCENEKVVVGIEVPRGSEPIYYCNGAPYLRHLTQSRPAEPHEVVVLVRAWLSDHQDADPLYNAIATAWANLTLFGMDLRGWQLGDGLQQLMSHVAATADALRTAAATDAAVESRLADRLRRIATVLDQAPAIPRFIGSSSQQQVSALLTQARDEVTDLYLSLTSTVHLSASERWEINRVCREHSRRIQDMIERLHAVIDGDSFVKIHKQIATEAYHIVAVLACHGAATRDGDLTAEARAAAALFGHPAQYPFYTDRRLRERIIEELAVPVRSLRADTVFAAV